MGIYRSSNTRESQELPHQITNQIFLKKLHLDEINIRDVPTDIGQ